MYDLWDARPPKCTRMPVLAGPDTVQSLLWNDVLLSGLLVTLDQDVIFSRGKGVLGTLAETGSDMRFFVLPAPKMKSEEMCYKRISGVRKEDDEETETESNLDYVGDPADLIPSKTSRCLKGIPFAVILRNCELRGMILAQP